MMRIARWMRDSETARRKAGVDRCLEFLETLHLFPFEPPSPEPWTDRTLLDIPPPLKRCPHCGAENADAWGCMPCGIVFQEWETTTKQASGPALQTKTTQDEGTARRWALGVAVFMVGLIAVLAAHGLASLFEFVSDLKTSPAITALPQRPSVVSVDNVVPAGITHIIHGLAPKPAAHSISPAPSGNFLAPVMPVYIPRHVTAPVYPAHGWSAQLMQYYSTGDARFLPPCR